MTEEERASGVDCVHWVRGSDPASHTCKLNVLQNPGLGYCRTVCQYRCSENVAKAGRCRSQMEAKTFRQKVVAGVSGNVRAVLGVNRVPLEVIEERNKVCLACPESEKIVGGFVSRCKKCGCVLWSKMHLSDQACPINKWSKYEPESGTGNTTPA